MKKENKLLLFECACCGKEMQPLTFFDGSIWCPKCRKNLFAELKEDNKRLEEDRDDFFGISQAMFARYLEISAGDPSRKEEALAYLKHAIAFCRKAAYKKNPYALLNLGYYYSLGYDESVHAETGKSFAKMCFDLAKKYTRDESLLVLLEHNLQALEVRVEKRSETDLSYMVALNERLSRSLKNASPRMGVFCLAAGESEGKAEVRAQLEKLARVCRLYLYNPQDEGRNRFRRLAGTAVHNVLDEAKMPVCWFGYFSERVAAKEYQPISRYFKESGKNKKEIGENMTSIRDIVEKQGIKGMDFYDQDLLIADFPGIYAYYKIPTSANDSLYDRLMKCYHAISGNS